MTKHNGAVDLAKTFAGWRKEKRRADQEDLRRSGARRVSPDGTSSPAPTPSTTSRRIFTDFDELAGDRAYTDDKAIVSGIARLDSEPVMIIGHQKGRETKGKIKRNFGMPRPEGYRKALRLMEMAERFQDADHHLHRHPGAYLASVPRA